MLLLFSIALRITNIVWKRCFLLLLTRDGLFVEFCAEIVAVDGQGNDVLGVLWGCEEVTVADFLGKFLDLIAFVGVCGARVGASEACNFLAELRDLSLGFLAGFVVLRRFAVGLLGIFWLLAQICDWN